MTTVYISGPGARPGFRHVHMAITYAGVPAEIRRFVKFAGDNPGDFMMSQVSKLTVVTDHPRHMQVVKNIKVNCHKKV